MTARHHGIGGIGGLLALGALLWMLPGTSRAAAGLATGKGSSGAVRRIVLDRVVAVVGNQAILESDVDEEMRFAAFQPAVTPVQDNTPHLALERVIDRTLIDRQRTLHPGLAAISQKEVDQSLEDMRASIPACASLDCKTDAGWHAFLDAHGFTQAEVEDRIRQRLAILKFIDVRFGMGARVSSAAVQQYYEQTLRPALEHDHAVVPPLDTVARRIREILRQRQINAMVDQSLKNLRGEQSVRILDPAYRDVEGSE